MFGLEAGEADDAAGDLETLGPVVIASSGPTKYLDFAEAARRLQELDDHPPERRAWVEAPPMHPPPRVQHDPEALIDWGSDEECTPTLGAEPEAAGLHPGDLPAPRGVSHVQSLIPPPGYHYAHGIGRGHPWVPIPGYSGEIVRCGPATPPRPLPQVMLDPPTPPRPLPQMRLESATPPRPLPQMMETLAAPPSPETRMMPVLERIPSEEEASVAAATGEEVRAAAPDPRLEIVEVPLLRTRMQLGRRECPVCHEEYDRLDFHFVPNHLPPYFDVDGVRLFGPLLPVMTQFERGRRLWWYLVRQGRMSGLGVPLLAELVSHCDHWRQHRPQRPGPLGPDVVNMLLATEYRQGHRRGQTDIQNGLHDGLWVNPTQLVVWRAQCALVVWFGPAILPDPDFRP